jgi:anti-sigma-K factor RskA
MSAHLTHDDLDLYALGVMEGQERHDIEAHLAACPECTQALAQARGRVTLLAMSLPPEAPPAHVKTRLMAQIRQETAPAPQRNRSSTDERSAVRGSGLPRWWSTILVPAFGALAVVTFVLWQQNERLDQQLAALHDAATKQQAQLDTATKLADLIGSSDTVTVNLAQQPGQPQGAAHVMYNMKMGMLMYDGQLDAAPAGKSYQLWVVPTQGNPISAGVFQPVPGQPDHWMMDMPKGLVPKAFAITLEPAGGMPQPTGPKVLVGVA